MRFIKDDYACDMRCCTLEENDDQKDEHRGEQISKVGQVGSVESLLESPDLVLAGDQEVEQSDQCTLRWSSIEYI